jgi:hypothetical protein
MPGWSGPSRTGSVLRRARRAAAHRAYGRGSADFARARVQAALDLLSWLDHRNLLGSNTRSWR